MGYSPDKVQEILALTRLPDVSVEAAAPLRLAAGQLLLVRSGGDARCSAGSGGEGALRLGVVDASGRRVALTLAGGDVELSFDGCSQAVLPWRAPAEGWEAALLRDAEALRGGLADGLRDACAAAERLVPEAATEAEVGGVGERARRALEAVGQRAETRALQEAVEAAARRVEAAA